MINYKNSIRIEWELNGIGSMALHLPVGSASDSASFSASSSSAGSVSSSIEVAVEDFS